MTETSERKSGNSKLVYDKATRTIVSVSEPAAPPRAQTEQKEWFEPNKPPAQQPQSEILPRCSHGNCLMDGAAELLEPSCGCRITLAAAAQQPSDLVKRLRNFCIDYDKSQLPDEAEPMPGLHVRDLRQAANRIEALEAENIRLVNAGKELIVKNSEFRSAAAAQPSPEIGLYEAIAHGDDIHRAWLKEALENWFAGKPVPPPRSAAAPPSREAERPSAGDWADEEADHLLMQSHEALRENIAVTLRHLRDEFVVGKILLREAAVVKAARRLIKNDDEERRILEPSCQECTDWNTPNNHDKGPCDWHELLAAVARYDTPAKDEEAK